MKFIRKNILIFLTLLSLIISLNTIKSLKSKHSLSLRNPEAFKNFLKSSLEAFANRIGKNQKSIIWENINSTSAKENFARDITIIFKTLFPENPVNEQMLGQGLKNESPEALKRLLFQVYLNNLYFSESNNVALNEVLQAKLSSAKSWPYPLASLICHGGRTVLLFDKQTEKNASGFAMEKLKLDLFVNSNLIKPRAASSHKLLFDKIKKTLTEEKIIAEAAWNGIQSVFGHYSHYGMNFPIGGLGNFWPDGASYVGPEGYTFQAKKNIKEKSGKKAEKEKFEKKSEKSQHGHMFLRFHNLSKSENNSAILFGLENEEPGFKGMFSKSAHNALSALHKKGEGASVCGGVKWEKLDGIVMPAGYGGRAVYFKKMLDFSVFEKIEAFDFELKKKVWWIILSANNQEFLEFYNQFLVKYDAKELEERMELFVQKKKK